MAKKLIIEQFFAQFEHRIYATQKTAIVTQQMTTISYDQENKQILFNVPATAIDWSILNVPIEIEVKKAGEIAFVPQTGNESSLEAYHFYWHTKGQAIIYHLSVSNG